MLVWVGILTTLFLLFWFSLPTPLFRDPYSLVLLDRNGDLLGASIARDEQWRFPAPDSLSPRFIEAITLYEDKRFFRHPGVDPLAMGRAIQQNIKEKSIVSGGSTLSMQVIRLARKGRPRTVLEKFRESILALRLEIRHSKTDILKLYAAHAPFGGNAVGIEAASWRYFGRPPEQLTWAENAMLAVLPNSPGLIHPGRNRDLLKEKRDALLFLLLREGRVDTLTCRLAVAEPLPSKPLPIPQLAPHLLQRVLCEDIADFPSASRTESTGPDHHPENNPTLIFLPNNPTHHIHTTLDKILQQRATTVVNQHQRRLANNHIHNACALILDVKTGTVLAYIGNVTGNTGEHGNWVDIITAPRSTGSILKPLLYAAMMQSGDLLPHTLVPDIPTRMGGFAPQNFDRSFLGAVPASMALSKSLNIPAVRMLHAYGIDRFYAFLKQCGMTTLFRSAQGYGLSLILGGAEGNLWEITGMYAGMAGMLRDYFEDTAPRTSRSVVTYFENDSKKQIQQMPLSAGSCWLTLKAMLEVVRPGDEAMWRDFLSSRKVSWKTGTSYGFRDAWAVGLTPEYAIGVWAGNADGEGRPELTGIRAAAPILFDLFNMLPPTTWFEMPEPDLVQISTCQKSGYRLSRHCAEAQSTFISPAGRKTGPCPHCQLIHCDSTGQWRVDSRSEMIEHMIRKKWFVLPPAMAWFYQRSHSDYLPLPPFRTKLTEDAATNRNLTLIYPDPGGAIYVPVELSGKRGRTIFEAAHQRADATLFWHLDETYLGETREMHQVAVAPSPGRHLITVLDDQGEMVQRWFNVLGK